MVKFFKIICLTILCFASVVGKASTEDNSSWGNSISEHFYADEVIEDSDEYEGSFFEALISPIAPVVDDDVSVTDPDAGEDPYPAPIDDYIPLLLVVGLAIGYSYKKKIIFRD
jgi:hypothetical protein